MTLCNPGAVLEVNRDLCFEPKDPTGKDTYLSAFIVWVYNEKAQDRTIRFEFLRDGEVCSSFPFGINFTGWRGAWVCYERDITGWSSTHIRSTLPIFRSSSSHLRRKRTYGRLKTDSETCSTPHRL